MTTPITPEEAAAMTDDELLAAASGTISIRDTAMAQLRSLRTLRQLKRDERDTAEANMVVLHAELASRYSTP